MPIIALCMIATLLWAQGGIGGKGGVGGKGGIGGGVSSGGTPISFVQTAGTTCGGSQNCSAGAFGSNTVAGHSIEACFLWGLTSGTGISLTSISDTNSDSFTVDTATKITAASTHFNEIGVECGHTTATIAGGADTVTCNASAATNAAYCTAFESTAINGTNPDKTATGTGTMASGASPPTTSSVTTTVNGEFLISATIIDDNFGAGGVFNAGSGFTIALNTGGGVNDSGSEYQAQSTAGAVTGNFTSPGNNGVWVVTMETVKP